MQDVEFKQGPLLDGWAIACGVGLVAFGVSIVVMEFALTPAVAIAGVLFLIVGLLMGFPRAEASALPAQEPVAVPAAPFDAPAPLMAAASPVIAATPAPLTAAAEPAALTQIDETANEARDVQAPSAFAAVSQRPASLEAARGGAADDLKQIKGVGPVLEKLLHALGYFHFDQIAAWTAAEVAWVDENLEGFKGRVTRDDWVPQARLLASGGSTEHSRSVAEGGVPG